MAHPDVETLWAGGTILSHPSRKFYHDWFDILRFYTVQFFIMLSTLEMCE
jgi:hypothetical protein